MVFNKLQLASIIKLVGDLQTDKIKAAYEKDAKACQQEHILGRGFARTAQGILLFLGKVYIPTTLRRELVTELHELLGHGHQGISKTRERVARLYYFPGLRAMVEKVIKNYDTCIRNKAAQHAPYGHMLSPRTPDRPQKSITLDFIVKLPPSKEEQTRLEYNLILVVTCRLTKYTEIILQKEASTVEDLANVLL